MLKTPDTSKNTTLTMKFTFQTPDFKMSENVAFFYEEKKSHTLLFASYLI